MTKSNRHLASPRFIDLIDTYVHSVDLDREAFLVELGAGGAWLRQAWKSPNKPRVPISRREINRVVHAIARHVDRIERREGERVEFRCNPNRRGRGDEWDRDALYLYGLDDLDELLNEFLESAGFSAIRGRPKNVVLDRVYQGKHRLVVAQPFSSAPAFTALLQKLTERVRDIMEVEVEFVDISEEQKDGLDFISAIHDGTIDVAATVLRNPSRLFHVSFSKPIQCPALRVGASAVCNRNHFPEATAAAIHRSKTLTDLEGTQVMIARGSIVRSLVASAVPAEVEVQECDDPIRELRAASRTTPVVVITDDIEALHLKAEYSELVRVDLVKSVAPQKPTRSLAFAAHPREPRLLEIIDAALEELEVEKFVGQERRASPKLESLFRDLEELHA